MSSRLMRKLVLGSVCALSVLMLTGVANAADGLVALKSPHSAAETASRFAAALPERGLKLFARIDHAAGAASIGKELRPTEVFIFGNPQGGTPLMGCQQSLGIDLPLKALVWQDASGQIWLGYNDPAWLVARHGGGECPAASTVSKALGSLAAAVVAP
ncbi:MAG: DUF302 domain-containing protein [Caldimonas sp.]